MINFEAVSTESNLFAIGHKFTLRCDVHSSLSSFPASKRLPYTLAVSRGQMTEIADEPSEIPSGSVISADKVLITGGQFAQTFNDNRQLPVQIHGAKGER